MSLRLISESIWHNPGNRGKRLRKTLEAIKWQFRKHLFGEPRVLDLPNGLRFKAYPDCVFSSALIYADWPEYHELMFLRENLRPKDVIVDVGAYVGHISLLLADVVGPEHIFAFEPTPLHYQRLVENWRLNGWTPEHLFQAAVGEEAGQTCVPDVSTPTPTNSVAQRTGREGQVEVPLVRLDDKNALWKGQSVGLLKLDVEGHEPEVLRGGLKFLSDVRPRIIMFESLEGTLDADVKAEFERCSYLPFQLDAEGTPDFDNASAQNLFAVPSELRSEFV